MPLGVNKMVKRRSKNIHIDDDSSMGEIVFDQLYSNIIKKVCCISDHKHHKRQALAQN